MTNKNITNDLNSQFFNSYLAGFIDGDGCIMAQIVPRKDYLYKYEIRVSIVLYQKTKRF